MGYIMVAVSIVLFTVLTATLQVAAKDVLGCGGFIKSHVPIDFSSVEVKLFTKSGVLKDKINCAPNNGYYFVPLYDKGEYILELEPPPGWSFTPTRVPLLVDGSSDLCSQGKDINFIFKGFGITGKVESLGTSQGPGGIEVELTAGTETRKTETNLGGTFFFTPVYPGKYIVKIVNSKWKVWKESVIVVVAEGNTELPKNSLIVQGYDVRGTVKTEGEPVKDTTIVLFSSVHDDKVPVDGCSKEPLEGLQNKKPICHVKSDENGIFKFETVPFGKYFIAPHYVGQNIYYQPSSIEFNVDHASIDLKEHFEIIGFSITGRVLQSSNGNPISNAKIYFNGKEITKTNSLGKYKLERLKTGSYNLKAESDGVLFKENTIKITPNVKELPDLIPVSYLICGHVVSDKSQTIAFSHIGSTDIITTSSDAKTGQFCEFLSPGKYQVQVVSQGDSQKGLQFFPKVQTVEVVTNEVGSITFSQLKATVSGKLQCIQPKDCTKLKILLKTNENIDKQERILEVSGSSYKLDNVYPGLYDVILQDNNLCWKSNKQTININNVNVEAPTFIQTGYLVVFASSHDTQVTYKLPGQHSIKTLNISKGRTSFCLEKPGLYHFNLNSCHSYENNLITYNTESISNELILKALKHRTILQIQSDTNQGNVTAVINIDGVKSLIGPLPFKETAYEIELMLSPGESVVIVPNSNVLYFTPPIMSISSGTDCENLGMKFKAVRGIVFEGKINPPLAGVLLTVETENSDAIMAETDQNGVYKFPPLDKSKTYTITAKKDSYVLIGPDRNGDFLAHKLAEIVIEVLDKADKAPLQGTLLSLSGGESYRSNLQTNEDGKITFQSLSPGEYFLRPMMKEYSFEPSSKIINVKEGQSVNVLLTGKRVAYSVYGHVVSLNGEPEESVVVIASGKRNCSHFSEESSSEAKGQFRIRGLQPYCPYDIKIKLNSLDKIERSVPKVIQLEPITKDIFDLRIIIFRKLANLDLLVKIFSKNSENYKNLRLKVIRESPHGIYYTGRVEAPSSNLVYNKGIFVQMPPIPIDGGIYSVHLEMMQSNKLLPPPQYVVANSSFKYIEFEYSMNINVVEQDIKQTSVWTLLFIFAIIFSLYNITKVSDLVQDSLLRYFYNCFKNFTVFKRSSANDYPTDNVDIDQIVQSINAVKRKPKPKKL